MNVTEFSQVVREPGDEQWTEEIYHRVGELLDQEPWTKEVYIKLTIGRILHPFGIHSWVRHKRYDFASMKLIDVGRVCWFCPRAYRR